MDKTLYSQLSGRLNFKPSETCLASHLAVDAGLAACLYLTHHGPLYLVSQLLVPVLMFRAFALMHDCVHGSASGSRVANDAVGIIMGALCLLPYAPWKEIHLAHHKWAGNVDKDPSMGLIKGFPLFSRARAALTDFCWKAGIPGLAISQHLVFWAKSYQFVTMGGKPAEKAMNALSIAVPLLLYYHVGLARNAPGLVLYLALVEIINFPHHLGMPMLRNDSSFPIYEQHKTARSCVYPGWLARHLLNFFNLHIEHHLFPRLPWYRLEKARKLLLASGFTSYTEVKGSSWIIENRRKPVSEVLAPNFTGETRHAA